MKSRALFVVALLAFNCGWVQAQSLADVARAEEARRQDVAKAKKVYTNNDLKPDSSRPAPPPAAAAGSAAPDTAKPAPRLPRLRPPRLPKGRDRLAIRPIGPAASARPAVSSNATAPSPPRCRTASTCCGPISSIATTRWSARPSSAIATTALAELDRLKKEMDEQAKGIAAIEEEARRAGVPAAWLRPS